MSTVLAVVDYVAIGIMLSISAGIGLYFRFSGGRQKTTKEFLMASQNMSILPVSFSIMATCYSAVSILGTPAEVYRYGIQLLLFELSYPIGGMLAVYLLLPVFFEMDVSTTYEYLEKRFGKTSRKIASLLFCIQIILYMPVVIYAPSLALSTVTGLSVWTSVLSMVSVCTFYSVLGGLKAVLWTDLFQSIMMIATMLALTIVGTADSGGIGNVYTSAVQGGRLNILNTALDFTERYTVWNCLVQGLMRGLYFNGTCHTQVQRLMSVRSIKRAQRAFIASLPVSFIFRLLCFLSGIVIYSYFRECSPLIDPDVKLSSSDQISPYFMIKLFGHVPGLTGLCIAGVFSASLSSMSSAVNSVVAVILEDFIKPAMGQRNLKDSTASLIAKSLVLMNGVLCVLLTLVISNSKKVIEVATIILGMVGGPTLGLYILGMFTTTANELGALIGITIGFTINAWMAFGTMYYRPEYPSLPLSISGCPSYTNASLTIDRLDNEESFYEYALENITDIYNVTTNEERYIFPLYRVSFMWFTFISCITVIITGYTSSLFIGIWKEQEVIKPQNLSPAVRKWIRVLPRLGKMYTKLPLRTNQIEFNTISCNCGEEDKL